MDLLSAKKSSRLCNTCTLGMRIENHMSGGAVLDADGALVGVVVNGNKNTAGILSIENVMETSANAWSSTSSANAVLQIIDACRYGASQLVITPQARLLRFVNGMFPSFVAESLGLVCRLLPGPGGADGDKLKRGWESQSMVALSLLTFPANRAVVDHKEQP
jgi:S1-C subfamily serine protease